MADHALVVDPPSGVNWEEWSQTLKTQVLHETGCSVSYRYRKQWGCRKVSVAGPVMWRQAALNRAMDILRNPSPPPPTPPKAGAPMAMPHPWGYPPVFQLPQGYQGWPWPFRAERVAFQKDSAQ